MTQAQNANTKFLDLDALDTEPQVVIKWGGKEHRLQQITVEGFLKNAKRLNSLGVKGSFEEEFELVLEMVCEAFPTINKEDLRKMELSKLNQILEFAREYNGENAVTERKDDVGNPPKAGE